jgi:hypothetical protein
MALAPNEGEISSPEEAQRIKFQSDPHGTTLSVIDSKYGACAK